MSWYRLRRFGPDLLQGGACVQCRAGFYCRRGSFNPLGFTLFPGSGTVNCILQHNAQQFALLLMLNLSEPLVHYHVLARQFR